MKLKNENELDEIDNLLYTWEKYNKNGNQICSNSIQVQAWAVVENESKGETGGEIPQCIRGVSYGRVLELWTGQIWKDIPWDSILEAFCLLQIGHAGVQVDTVFYRRRTLCWPKTRIPLQKAPAMKIFIDTHPGAGPKDRPLLHLAPGLLKND